MKFLNSFLLISIFLEFLLIFPGNNCQEIISLNGTCLRGYFLQKETSNCVKCESECFDKWEIILSSLKNQTIDLIDNSTNLKATLGAGSYTNEFNTMKMKLDEIHEMLESRTIQQDDLQKLNKQKLLSDALNVTLQNVEKGDTDLEKHEIALNSTLKALESLESEIKDFRLQSNEFKSNGTKLQEENVDGALKLIKDSWNKINKMGSNDLDVISNGKSNANRLCNQTREEMPSNETLINKKTLFEVDSLNVANLTSQIIALEEIINEALVNTEIIHQINNETSGILQIKEEKSKEILNFLQLIKTNSSQSFYAVEKLHLDINDTFNNQTFTEGLELVKNQTALKQNKRNYHDEIDDLTKKIKAMNFNGMLEQIQNLSKKSDEAVASLSNVDEIISQTKNNLTLVENLKNKAIDAKTIAENGLKMATIITNALNETQEIQRNAEKAILTADGDIEDTRLDLINIGDEKQKLNELVNNNTNKVIELDAKLLTVNQTINEHHLNANEILTETENLTNLSNQAEKVFSDYKNRVNETQIVSNEKKLAADDVKLATIKLLNRAIKLSNETTDQLAPLKTLLLAAEENDRKIKELDDKLLTMNKELDEYLADIESDSNRYRQCST